MLPASVFAESYGNYAGRVLLQRAPVKAYRQQRGKVPVSH